MAVTEDDIIRDEQERSNLLRVISDGEAAIAASPPGTRRVIENMVENGKKRVSTLDKKIDDAKVERQAEEQSKIAAANLVEKEKALSASEKETYGGLLKEAFFTKKDFSKLEHFYAHSWDRLTEGGKDELSHRFWEGIRHGEYKFSDAPRAVREKEEDLIYSEFSNPTKKRESLEQIPESDRADFTRAYTSGNRDEAAKVLNRESFRKNTALEFSAGVKHQSSVGKEANDETLLSQNKPQPQSVTLPNSPAGNDLRIADVNLKGVTLADAHTDPSSATMPDASGSRVNVRSPA